MLNIKALLGHIKEETGLSPQAFEIDSAEKLPALSYTLYRASDDGAKAQWRLQTRITARTYAQLMELEQSLADALVTVGDTTKLGCSISVSGGGTMLEPQTGLPQQLTYFDITARS